MLGKDMLLGKTIKAIYLAEDKQAIRFEVVEPNTGVVIDLVVRCDGDCCSITWIENIENPSAIIDSPILSVENLDMPDEQTSHPEDAKRDVVVYYGLKIESAKGTCTLDYRNESNGYYGGSLAWPDGDYYYGGVFGQNKSKEVWQPVSEGA